MLLRVASFISRVVVKPIVLEYNSTDIFMYLGGHLLSDKNEGQIVKRTIKDSVFTDYFRIPSNLLALYKVLHPEDENVTISDLKDITVENVLVDEIYNDLGFRVSDRLIILVEAQTTWTVNIIIRALLYLAKTYKDYIDDNGLDIYNSTKIQIPKPELYVLYTGDRKARSDEISLKEEFFKDDENVSIDVKIKVLYGTGEDDVISQYVAFTKVYDEQRKLYGRNREAILETIRICKDKNVLKEYLENREKEVVDMLMTLFDEEQILKNHDANLTREVLSANIKSIMNKLAYTAEEAMDLLNVPEDKRAYYKSML